MILIALRVAFIALLLALVVGCATLTPPPNLDPAVVPIWQANEAVVIVGTVQRAAIGLNGVQLCEPLPCHPLLSTANTGLVVDAATDALVTLRAAPSGWKGVALAALDRIALRLDAAGITKFTPYLAGARLALLAIH